VWAHGAEVTRRAEQGEGCGHHVNHGSA
jgi:hypothetical protein